jgi:hypothetical protein
MTRRGWMNAVLATVLASAALSGALAAGAAPDNALYARCGKACADCMKACAACERHCAAMIKAGHKEHGVSQRLSEDTRDLCALCAKLCQRKGPSAAAAAEACRKSCEACGAECRKYPNMAPMAACAKACATCAKACADLVAASP